MSRSRTNGALATLILAAGLVAGCGSGGGQTAAQSAPAGGTSTAPATPAPAATAGGTGSQGAAESVVSAFPAEDPKDSKFRGYDRFPMANASGIFVPPAAAQKAENAGSTDPTATPTGSTTAVPAGSTGSTAPTPTSGVNAGATPPGESTGSPREKSVNVAQAEIDGTKQALKKGDKVPSANPLFTVQSVEATKVVLKLNSGTFPGGSSTIDITAGASVTLSNPSSGAAIVILVRSITPVAV